MGEQEGEFIQVIWDYGRDVDYVRGHVAFDVARDEIEAHTGARPGGHATHTWARWVPDATGEYDMRFHPCGPGPGAFKVTEVAYELAALLGDG